MRNIDIVCLSFLAAFGCRSHEANPETSREQLNPRPNSTATADNVAADNTARNDTTGTAAPNMGAANLDRDHAGAAAATDQGEAAADRDISQHVREAVMKHDELSTNAKNVKIITRDGVVTLRGPVASEQEKSALMQAAKETSGVKRVDAEVEVTQRLSAAQGSSTPSPSNPEEPSTATRSGSKSAPR